MPKARRLPGMGGSGRGNKFGSSRCFIWRCWKRSPGRWIMRGPWLAGTCPSASACCGGGWKTNALGTARGNIFGCCGYWKSIRCPNSGRPWSRRWRSGPSAGMRLLNSSFPGPTGGSRRSHWMDIPICDRCVWRPLTSDNIGNSWRWAMSKDPSVLLLEHHLKALKLPTLLRDYASVAAVCAQERCDYPQYLLRLTERELIDRERRATERRIKEAQFPVIKTSDSFDFGVQTSINEPLVRELLRGEYIGKKENVLLVGNPGTGKTHLATALGFAACSQGKRVRFTTTTALVTQLLEQRENRSLQRLYKQLQRQDVLIL